MTPPMSFEFMNNASPYLVTDSETEAQCFGLMTTNEDRLRRSPCVKDVPLLSEVLPSEVTALRVPAHVDDDVNYILLRDQVRGQRQVQ